MVTFDTYTNVLITFPCPKCQHPVETPLPALIRAVNGDQRIFCAACERRFILKVELLDPRRPTTDEAVEAGQATLFTSGELVAMCNSLGNIVIDASSKGYVSSNDLDFANDCLEKVIPLLP